MEVGGAEISGTEVAGTSAGESAGELAGESAGELAGDALSGQVTSDIDRDLDGIADDEDNCPDVFNPQQTDIDGDQEGDACEPDIDLDGIPNAWIRT